MESSTQTEVVAIRQTPKSTSQSCNRRSLLMVSRRLIRPDLLASTVDSHTPVDRAPWINRPEIFTSTLHCTRCSSTHAYFTLHLYWVLVLVLRLYSFQVLILAGEVLVLVLVANLRQWYWYFKVIH